MKNRGVPTWLDIHDMNAGDIDKQVSSAIRVQDIVLLVLSKESVASDWVERELKSARKKEKSENRDVICPIALDDSWKAKVEDNVLWGQIEKKNVLDFSGWQSNQFDEVFEKLLRGPKTNYSKSDG